MRPEDKSPDLPQSYDELRLLYLEVYNENMQLRKLLEKHHILYQDEIEKECSPISPVEQQTPSGEVNQMYLLGNGAVKRAKSAIVPCAKMNGKPAFVESPK